MGAQYTQDRYNDANSKFIELDGVYKEYNEVHNKLDKDLPLKMHDGIRKLANLPYHTACHYKTEKKIEFDKKMYFHQEPKMILTQQNIAIHYDSNMKTGKFESAENPITLNKIDGIYKSYDVVVPDESKSKLCVFFFLNADSISKDQ